MMRDMEAEKQKAEALSGGSGMVPSRGFVAPPLLMLHPFGVRLLERGCLHLC